MKMTTTSNAEATERTLRLRPLVFVDVETTGLDPMFHEVIELCAVRVESPSLVFAGGIEARIHPNFPERCSPEAAAVNGYSEGAWEYAEELEPVLRRFAELAGGAIVVGHNVAFDLAFLKAAFRRAGLEPPKWDYHSIDTASLAWPLVAAGVLNSVSLRNVCGVLGIDHHGHHGARVDVERTMEVYRLLVGAYVRAIRGAQPRSERPPWVTAVVDRVQGALAGVCDAADRVRRARPALRPVTGA